MMNLVTNKFNITTNPYTQGIHQHKSNPIKLTIFKGNLEKKETDKLLRVLKAKDEYFYKHSLAVEQYSTNLALAYAEKTMLKNPDNFIENIKLAAKLHDIGKLRFPDSLLVTKNIPKEAKPEEYVKSKANLSEEKRKAIEKHSKDGQKFLMVNPLFHHIAKIVRHHHEDWDGSGYPSKLKRKEIPIESRIIRITDSFDSMVSKRPYWQECTLEQAMNRLNEEKSKKFDPELTDLFLEIVPKLYHRVEKEIYKHESKQLDLLA